MRGVILAGGSGSRLKPLTSISNKHLIPVHNKQMILYPLETLKKSGIKDILVVTGTEHIGGFMHFLGSGKQLGVNLTYKVQDGSGGIADALRLAKDFVNKEKFAVILGDNYFEDSFSEEAITFLNHDDAGAVIFLKEVEHPQRFGVVELVNNMIVRIEEKPQNPKSNLAVTGLYMFNNDVFKIIEGLKPSGRGELEITDVNNYYVAKKKIYYCIVKNHWSDMGTFKSLHETANYIYAKDKNV